jgi:hypothetical protein
MPKIFEIRLVGRTGETIPRHWAVFDGRIHHIYTFISLVKGGLGHAAAHQKHLEHGVSKPGMPQRRHIRVYIPQQTWRCAMKEQINNF